MIHVVIFFYQCFQIRIRFSLSSTTTCAYGHWITENVKDFVSHHLRQNDDDDDDDDGRTIVKRRRLIRRYGGGISDKDAAKTAVYVSINDHLPAITNVVDE